MHKKQLLPITVAVLLTASAWSIRTGTIIPRDASLLEQQPEQHVLTAASAGTVENAGVPVQAQTRPARVIAHYGFSEDGYKPCTVVEFGEPTVGVAIPGTITSAGGDTVSVKSPDGTFLTYSSLVRVTVSPGQVVKEGDPIGTAVGPVTLRAECGGRTIDPVALLWPEMSRFSAEAKQVEEKRKKLAEEFRRRALLATLGRLRPPEDIGKLIRNAAKDVNLDPVLVAAVAAVESGFNPHAVSPAGAMGVMQLMPGTAAALDVSDPFDPVQNIRAGARYLRNLLDKFGKLELALAAYNAGPGAVERYGGVPPYPETQAYVRAVLNLYAKGGEKPL